jgi:hypothetical protein
MTEAPRGFDCSFLNEEEARKILQVLERNEQLQRVEKDRIRYRALSFPFAGLLERGVRGAPAGDLATGAVLGRTLRSGRGRCGELLSEGLGDARLMLCHLDQLDCEPGVAQERASLPWVPRGLGTRGRCSVAWGPGGSGVSWAVRGPWAP